MKQEVKPDDGWRLNDDEEGRSSSANRKVTRLSNRQKHISKWRHRQHKIELLLAELRIALHTRTVQPGLIHHYEQSVQYAAADYVAVLHRHIQPPVEFEASLTQLAFSSFSGVRYTDHSFSSG